MANKKFKRRKPQLSEDAIAKLLRTYNNYQWKKIGHVFDPLVNAAETLTAQVAFPKNN